MTTTADDQGDEGTTTEVYNPYDEIAQEIDENLTAIENGEEPPNSFD